MNYSKKYCHKTKKINNMFQAHFSQNNAGGRLFSFIFNNKILRKQSIQVISDIKYEQQPINKQNVGKCWSHKTDNLQI